PPQIELSPTLIERSGANPSGFHQNAPNPPHWTLNSCFGALYGVWVPLGSFCNSMKLNAKQGELVQLMQKFVPRSHVRIFRNERTQSTPLDPNLLFWCVA